MTPPLTLVFLFPTPSGTNEPWEVNDLSLHDCDIDPHESAQECQLESAPRGCCACFASNDLRQ